jgi:nucleoside-diphosphate kinase
MEHSLVIIKPDAYERKLVGKILERLESVGLTILNAKVVQATDLQIDMHYQINNDDYCISIGCKNFNLPVVTFDEAIDIHGHDKAIELRNYGKMILDWNRNFMKRSPLIIFIFKGTGAIARIRSISGTTNPPSALPGTIRFDFGIDSFDLSNAEKRGCENLIHASGDITDAKREIRIWFPELIE